MDEVDPKYLIPLFDRIFCCLPESLRRKLRCNLHFQDPRVSAQVTYQPDGSHMGESSKFSKILNFRNSNF